MTDKRFWFFLAAAGACALLVPASPTELRWVPRVMVVVYLVLALLVGLEILSRRRHDEPPPPGPSV